jgi:predicted ArsR family transcriptional regulator
LPERVQALALARDVEGYMAEVEAQGDGSLLLVENHCPICAAARDCQNFCRSELEVFQRVLGPACSVVREEHILAGERRCAYRIKPV